MRLGQSSDCIRALLPFSAGALSVLPAYAMGHLDHLADVLFLNTERFEEYGLWLFSPFLFGYLGLLVVIGQQSLAGVPETVSFADMILYRKGYRKSLIFLLDKGIRSLCRCCMHMGLGILIPTAVLGADIKELAAVTVYLIRLTAETGVFQLWFMAGVMIRHTDVSWLFGLWLTALTAMDAFAGKHLLTYSGSILTEGKIIAIVFSLYAISFHPAEKLIRLRSIV
jgi:hypothetical protein